MADTPGEQLTNGRIIRLQQQRPGLHDCWCHKQRAKVLYIEHPNAGHCCMFMLFNNFICHTKQFSKHNGVYGNID